MNFLTAHVDNSQKTAEAAAHFLKLPEFPLGKKNINISYEYRCKNPQQNTSKWNPAT